MEKNSPLLHFKMKFLGVLLLIFVFNTLHSQNDYTIHFQEDIIEFPENIQTFDWNQMPEKSHFNDGFYGWVQFYETPNQIVQDRFRNANLQLIEYIPHKTYLFYFPENTSISFLQYNGVRGIIPLDASFKISKELNYPPFEPWAMDGTNYLVTLQYHENVTSDFVINKLKELQITVKQEYKNSNLIDLSIPDNCLEELANLPFVKWIELIIAPDVKDDTRGRSLHRANGLDPQTSVGNNYTGVGVGVLVRDDGIVGPHIDFQGRLDNSQASGTGQTHGDGVAGIMAGAGNLNPRMRGMAAGADVYVSNYASNFLDTPTQNLINNDLVQITNSSYSNGCNDGYTTTARTVDLQSNDIPSLLHVFSAGNSNNNNCGYGAGTQWGNITGGHKQGKNVIATANVFYNATLVASSSRGPAHDGRIKPDITANGQNQNSTSENNQYLVFGGTSGAAPGIAGVSAQLYELYAELNGGNHPPSSLIKAALLNTANDYGNVGPDFKFGWGIVNGTRAGKLIEDERYLTDEISQGNSNTHTINVPTGTSQVRFMVYWNDPAATPGANPALVNDLDLVVTNPSNDTFLPWILDPTPNPTNLDTPATNGVDNLNNMEQVLINDPDSGNYDIEITGSNVPVGPQEYFVVYEIITDQLVLTYPNGEESFFPNAQETIHWDATNTSDDFLLEYSTDSGSSWNTITTVNNSLRLYDWSVPNEITGNAMVRVSSGSLQDESDNEFSIADFVGGVIQVTQVCPEEASFNWNAVADAESYDFYLLGENYMEIVGSSTTSNITVPITNPDDELWFAVVAKNDTEEWISRRSNAQFYGGGLLNCSLANDVALLSINNDPSEFNFVCNPEPVVISATVANTGLDPQSNITIRYQINSEPVVEENISTTLNSGDQIDYEFDATLELEDSGEYTLMVEIELTGDENPSNDDQSIDFYSISEATSLDFSEDFETNGFPPSGWQILNPDNDDTWEERSGILGSDGATGISAYFNNFSYNAEGEEDVFQTEIFDLTFATSAQMTFDLAKAQYSTGFSDGLRVEISTDCGQTFATVYEKSGLDLSTMPSYITSNWTPSSAGNWRQEQVDLTDYLGELVQFRFINVCGYGNSTFIDNINVEGFLSNQNFENLQFTMYPNPASNEVFLRFGNAPASDLEINISNALGQTVYQSNSVKLNGDQTAILNVSGYATGLYFISIKQDNSTIIKKLIVK
ncbi:S8 family serine peptidase [Planktosalinus lacus]|uniref:Uncharacterized protein n=1 Tax=Planktosalinus lacus TaxID=1526573 RepID=A0A8J2Y8B2_9FLAO|nr:S8 family serine peptidase [Planktosalinus lacus]GGE01137.1 hypothetical protein GCM10011312_25740 [Planktosalinus lacus]